MRIHNKIVGILAGMLALTGGRAQAAVTVTQVASHVYSNLYGITADASGLYVTGSTGLFRDFSNAPANGVIGHVAFTGGAVQTLYSASNYAGSGHVAPFQIVTDGMGNLTWADPDAGPSTGASFFSGTTGGAAVNQFFGICCGASVLPGDGIGVGLLSNVVYFSDGDGGRVGSNPSGSSATQIGPTRYSPDFSTEAWAQISVVGTKIYIADSAEQRGASNGVEAVYDESASIAPGVRYITTDGTSGFQTITTAIAHPQGIVAVGHKLYVTDGNTVYVVNATTGATHVLVHKTQFFDLQGITWWNGALYVVDSGNKFGAFVSGVASATSHRAGVIWKIVP